MTKQDLEGFNALETEISYLRDAVKREQKKQLSDTVRGSSSEWPYIAHPVTIEGVSCRTVRKLQSMLRHRSEYYEALLDWVDRIEDVVTRTAIQLYYMSGKRVTWQWVATQMKRPQDADAIKKTVSRFFRRERLSQLSQLRVL